MQPKGKLSNMATKIKLLSSAQVGERITKFVQTAAHTASELHDIMVQCALHVQEHGDTSLVERLVNELMVNQDEKLKGAAAINVAGIRAWFGTFCPLQMRGSGPYKITMLDKDSTAYANFLERATKLFGEPDEVVQRSGNRAFYIGAGNDRPFWDMADVQRQQRINIRPIGLGVLIGNVLKLENDFTKAVQSGLVPGASKDVMDEFVKTMAEAARKFRAEHAVELLDEPERLAELKKTLELAEQGQATAVADAAGVPNEAKPEVGGDVTSGEQSVDNPDAKTGTEG